MRDCSLENGALVAANSVKAYYNKEAKHYFYVWPRDGAFTCVAANVLGINDIQEKFFDWIVARAEDIDETGLLYEKYYVNGLQALHRFQPDQGGAVLWAIKDHFKGNPEGLTKYKELVEKLARGLCHHWEGTHFKLITNDLWEERHTFPDLKDNFSYALATCSRGLLAANEMYPDPMYLDTAKEMQELLIDSAKGKGYFYRSFGVLDDDHTDASLLGLAWPFDMIDVKDPLYTRTVEIMLEKIVINGGLHRYELDEYDGWMYRGFHRKKGAGYWPLLSFWLAIVLDKMGRREEALKYYFKVLDDIDLNTGLIPEQIFNNDLQKAVSPLCWSHSMFVLATKELGLLESQY